MKWQVLVGVPYLKERFRQVHGYEMNLDAPKTFSEKVQWRKVYDDRPIWSLLCDKYHCKRYVRERLGREMQPETLDWVKDPTELADDIHLQDVVLKCTHTSGRMLVCGADTGITRGMVNRLFAPWVRAEFGTRLIEQCYGKAEKAIIVEPKLLWRDGSFPPDAKFQVFDGKVKLIQFSFVDFFGYSIDSAETVFLNPDWTVSDIRRRKDRPPEHIPGPPEFLDEMIEVAETLAEGLDYVRVDFMLFEDRFLVGELTMYPSSGLKPMGTYEMDEAMGAFWTLPDLGAASRGL